MKWFVLEKTGFLELPEYVRTFGLSDQGLVYVASAITQLPEGDVLHRLDADPDPTIPMAQYNDHDYMPSSWLAKAYPEIADVCQLFEQQAKKIIADSIMH